MVYITTIIDLTIIGNCIIYICTFYLMSYIFDFKVLFKDKVVLSLMTLVCATFFLFNVNLHIYLLIYLILFIFRFKKKFYYLLIYYFLIYTYFSFLMIQSPNLIARYALLHLSKSSSFVFYLIPLINILLIRYIVLLYRMMIKKMKYKYKVVVSIGNKIYQCSGYYDSGNTLIHNLKPVIFMYGIEGEEEIKYDCASSSKTSKYVTGSVFVNGKGYDVYVASSARMFNGCSVLLNALLI